MLGTIREGLASAALAAVLFVVPASAQDAASEIVWGDTLPSGLDPHAVFDVPMQFYMLNTYDTLFRYIGNPPDLEPWLAESFEVSEDGLTWTIGLKDGVVFHDGTPLTAQDVVYSFQRVLGMGQGPAGAFRSYLQAENITAPDDLTVQFVLDESYAPFHAALPLVAIVNSELLQANEANGDWGSAWLSSNSAGSGAYQPDPDTYRPLETLDLARNADHFYGWDDNPNPIDIVRAYPVRETSTRVLALLNGEIHATDSYLPSDQVERVRNAAGVHVAEDESMRVMVIRMNNSKAPFDNLDFRRCISYAMNYDGFNQIVMGGYAARNAGPIPQNLWGSPDDLEPYTYDMDRAAEYCESAREAGAPIDRPLEIHIQSELDQTTQVAQLLQSDLRQLGVNLEVVPATWANLTTQATQAATTPDMWVHWVSTYFVDPENWIGQMYDSQFHGTWKASSWYQNDQVDELLGAARSETDQETRRGYYEEASRLVVADAVDLWIYNTIQLRGMSDRVEGYRFSPVGSGGEMRWMSINP